GRPQVILDVAHNVEAAKTLDGNLAASGFAPETIAVCGMLRDKDIEGVLRAVANRITRWHLASLRGPRAASAADLAARLASLSVEKSSVHTHDSPALAFAAAPRRSAFAFRARTRRRSSPSRCPGRRKRRPRRRPRRRRPKLRRRCRR